MKRISICNIPVDAYTMEETVGLIDDALQENRPIHHVVINAAKVVNANKNVELMDSIVNCDIINADGQGVVWASRFLNKPLPERVAGIDLMDELIALAHRKGYKIYLLGAKEEIVSKVARILSEKYSPDIIGGYRNGYYKPDEELEIARSIGSSGAKMLFVAITSPKKEIFLNKYKDEINVPFIMGVGGSFDVVAGFVKRAPRWMQVAGLEWFYRVIQEPRRMWKRYLVGNIEFGYLVMKEKMQFNKAK
ncbi:WecB/TagA/CpsF family glycosyltransferase [Flavihumibacter petaseus]|nr:WecB/TagA/CpsF family glycosyltransferase [Flavihumibacter petaseus]